MILGTNWSEQSFYIPSLFRRRSSLCKSITTIDSVDGADKEKSRDNTPPAKVDPVATNTQIAEAAIAEDDRTTVKNVCIILI